MKSTCFIALTIAVLPLFADVPEVPLYVLSAELKDLRINVLGAGPVATKDPFPETDVEEWSTLASAAVGRSGKILRVEQLSEVPRPPSYQTADVNEHGYFDLWNIVSEPGFPIGAGVEVAFSIDSEASSTGYLGLGSSDQVLVLLNDTPVFAHAGRREMRRDENIVTLRLKRGVNAIRILCFKHQTWETVPARHSSDEWSLLISFFKSAREAWDGYRLNNYHPFDSPIVRSVDDFRATAVVEGHASVELLDLDNNVVLEGELESDGAPRWVRGDYSGGEFVGALRVGGNHAEYVLITNGRPVEEIADTFQARVRGPSPWAARLKAILNPGARSEPDRWWARNFVLALAMSLAVRPESVALESTVPSARIRLIDYISEIDGSMQFVRFFLPRAVSSTTPLLIVVPTVQNPVRPFLSGYTMNALAEAEMMASTAERFGAAVVWPGVCDVDYGGALTLKQIEESVDAFLRTNPAATGPQYVLGTCSSGVTVLNYAIRKTGLAGVLLHSPFVSRRRHRWMPGFGSTGPSYPAAALAPFQPLNGIRDLEVQRVLALYDSDMPGHGDREGTHYLVDQLRSQVPDVVTELLEPVPLKEYIYGERYRTRLTTFFEWVQQHASADNKSAECNGETSDSIPEVPATVQEALLSGFYCDKNIPAIWQSWRNSWSSSHARYRGVPLPEERFHPDSTSVTFEIASAQEFRLMLDDPAYGKAVLDPAVRAGILESNVYFAVSLDGDGKAIRISATESSGPFPELDLLVDGCFRSALWTKTRVGWELVELWL